MALPKVWGWLLMTLGELLKASRNRLGMTLDDVADAAGCSKSHLHGLEGDKCEPGIVMCARLSVALGVPVQAMAAAALTGALKSPNAEITGADRRPG